MTYFVKFKEFDSLFLATASAHRRDVQHAITEFDKSSSARFQRITFITRVRVLHLKQQECPMERTSIHLSNTNKNQFGPANNNDKTRSFANGRSWTLELLYFTSSWEV